MRLLFLFFFLWFSSISSQEITQKTFPITSKEVNINTEGLDELTIENSETDNITIILKDENPNAHAIISEEKKDVLELSFSLDFLPQEERVFRKYITKRIERAVAVVKIPKHKQLTIHGEITDVISKNYQGDIAIYLKKGMINLNEAVKNVTINIFQGNIFASLANSSVSIQSNYGKITIDEKEYQGSYVKENPDSLYNFSVTSIHGNVTLEE